MSEKNSNQRVLEILRMLIEQPFHYTARKLSTIYKRDVRTIQGDITDLENAGFLVDRDEHHRYFLVNEKLTDKLEETLVLTQNEKDLLITALKNENPSEAQLKRLVSKIENLSQLPSLGNVYFSNHYLQKLNLLSKAQKNQLRVKLRDYRSTNSNSKTDRIIEPFHIAIEDDIVHAFDLRQKEVRHFRISRIDRIESLEENWEFAKHHYVAATDIFRITSREQETIHLRLKIGAVNELLERYPLSKAYLEQTEAEVFELKCKVNANFYGLQNFLLGYHAYVLEIVESKKLKTHMNTLKQNINY